MVTDRALEFLCGDGITFQKDNHLCNIPPIRPLWYCRIVVKLNILTILDFGDVIYKIASKTLLNKSDAVYHSAVRFTTKAPYTTHHCDLCALVGWPSLHTRRQTHWLQVIYKTLLGKVPPYVSSLVTIAAPTCSTRSSRYISLVTPKNNLPLAASPSSSLLPMTGTNYKNL